MDLSPENPTEDLLPLYHLVARNAYDQGKIKKCIRILEKASQIDSETQEAGSLNALWKQKDLAQAYLSDGDSKRAVCLLERIVYGEDAFSVLDEQSQHTMQESLADAYVRDGRVNDAVSLLEKVVSAREQLSKKE